MMERKHRYAECARRLRAVAALALAAASAAPAFAGGPLLLSAAGTPFRWDATHPVRCAVSSGNLSGRSHSAAVAILSQALQSWQQTSGAQLQFTLTGTLTRNVDGATVASFLDGLAPSDPSPILMDNDGSITEAINGRGASRDIVGFAMPFHTDAPTGQIQVSVGVFNGPLLDAFSDAYVRGTMVHELGHFVNLEHSLVNAAMLYDGDPTNDGLTPEMFYRGPNDPGTLSTDDRAWFSWLYPSADAASRTGSIQGRVLLPDGVTGLQGVHVVARRVGDPLVTAVGAVSGWQFRSLGGGMNDPAALGQFLIPSLPPGNYTVEVEMLPYVPSIGIAPAYLVGGPKFWHPGSSAQDSPEDSSQITVEAGQVASGIDIVLNGENLGDPQPVQKKGPNALPNPQHVRLPAIISGSLDDGPAESGAGSSTNDPTQTRPLQSPNDLQDVYRVALGDWTIVTAILSAQTSAADLDLYVLDQENGQWVLEGASTQTGTPPEVVQRRLSPGIHYFGVRRAGTSGSAYTLQLLGSPAPDPDQPPLYTSIGYLLLGNVTTSSADAHWITTDPTPSVLYYNLPAQEIGSTQPERQHALSLTGLTSGQRSEVDVFAASPAGLDSLQSLMTAASEPAADGSPRLVAGSNVTQLDDTGDFVMITSHLTNAGDGDARQVRIEQMILPDGWYFVWELSTRQALPVPLEVGDIGAGGAGAFVAEIYRESGSAKPHITLHGSYTDAAGNPEKF